MHRYIALIIGYFIFFSCKTSPNFVFKSKKLFNSLFLISNLCKSQFLNFNSKINTSNQTNNYKQKRQLQEQGPEILTNINGSMCQFEFYNNITDAIIPMSVEIILDQGNPIILYLHINQNLILEKCFDPICNNKTSNLIDRFVQGNLNSFSIVLNSNQYPVISYWVFNPPSTRIATCLDVSCNSLEIIILKNGSSTINSITLKPNNNPFLLTSSSSNILTLFSCNNPICSSFTEIFNANESIISRQSIVLYNSNLPIFIYTKFNPQTIDLVYNFCQDEFCNTIDQKIFRDVTTIDSYIQLNKNEDIVILIPGPETFLFTCFDNLCLNMTNITLNFTTRSFLFDLDLSENINPVILSCDNDAAELFYCFTNDCEKFNKTVLLTGDIAGCGLAMNNNNPVIVLSEDNNLVLGVCTRTTLTPTISPSNFPTLSPSLPTMSPSLSPTISPSNSPSQSPSLPTISPSLSPTISPNSSPSQSPSLPTNTPSLSPSLSPTEFPTNYPTKSPTSYISPNAIVWISIGGTLMIICILACTLFFCFALYKYLKLRSNKRFVIQFYNYKNNINSKS